MAETADTALVPVPPAGSGERPAPDPKKEEKLPDEGREMTLMEHMVELRDRLVKAVLGLAGGTVIGFIFARRVFDIFIASAPDTVEIVALSPTDTIIQYFKVALVLGCIVGMPVILYQILQFVLPGLYPHEKRYLFWLLPAATIAFASGALFSGFLVVPTSIRYLSGFMADVISPTYQIQSYLDFVTSLMFWVGIVFEMPLVIFFLAKLDVIDHKKLASWRKYAIVISAVAAAIITPTPDPVTMMMVMSPLIVLYEIGIILARIA